MNYYAHPILCARMGEFLGVGSPLGDASCVVSGTLKITADEKANLNATTEIPAGTAGVVAM